jgi:hypothetical protein
MAIDNQSGKVIPLSEARDYTHNFQNIHPNEIKGFFVGKEKLMQILSQPDCIGIRIYNGVEPETNVANRVLIGVDVNTDEMETGVILERLISCPNDCGRKTVL